MAKQIKYYTYVPNGKDNWHFLVIPGPGYSYTDTNHIPVLPSCVKKIFGKYITTENRIPPEWRLKWLNK